MARTGVTKLRADLIRGLVDLDSRSLLQFSLDDPNALPEVAPGHSGQVIDDDLQELKDRGWISGERQTYPDGSYLMWSGVRVTLEGLRELSDWPPSGFEYVLGPWSTMVWGQRDLPLLKEFQRNPPASGYIFKPVSGEPPERIAVWNAYLRLLEGGLISGVEQQEGLDKLRITDAGKAAIDPPDDDPLDRARMWLSKGAKADAITAAVEEALKECLHALAKSHSVPIQSGKGELANLNNDLRKAGAYGAGRHGESVRHDVEGWLKVRTDVDHGGGASVPATRIQQAIDGIEQFRATYCP
jgi:hypothetical protein